MITVDLKNAEERQTLKGFGTSACWWSQNLSDETTIDEISDLLYSEKGLNLNIYRYNGFQIHGANAKAFSFSMTRTKTKATKATDMILGKTKMPIPL